MKKGYFFTLDAMISMGILVLGSMLIFSAYTRLPSQTQASELAQGTMEFLSSTKIKDLNNEYVGIGGILWNAGNITNGDNTLLQQMGQFYYEGNTGNARVFLQNVTAPLIPGQFRLEFWIDSRMVYPKEADRQHNASKNSTTILIPSKKIVYGTIGESAELFGPYEAEALVWQ